MARLAQILALITHVIGFLIFARGFLAGRQPLPACTRPDHAAYNATQAPQPFSKAIVLIVDALRSDFAFGDPPLGDPTLQLRSLLDTAASAYPDEASIQSLRVSPPTSTHHRLRALLTGTVPPPLEHGQANEDSLLHSLHSTGLRTVFSGDDTWLSLFPNRSLYTDLQPMPSFLVHDLHTCDNGVSSALDRWLLEPDKWDVAFGHFLGVDHAGHTLSATSDDMRSKLAEMDNILKSVFARVRASPKLLNNTLVLVLGDHGQTLSGDHGGGSDAEIESALFAFAPKHKKGKDPRDTTILQNNSLPLDSSGSKNSLSDFDVAPTLAFSLGLPLPYGSIGKLSEPIIRMSPGFQSSPKALQWALKLNARHALDVMRRYGLRSAHLEHDFEHDDSPSSLRRVLQSAAASAMEQWASFKQLPMLFGFLLVLAATLFQCTDTFNFQSCCCRDVRLVVATVGAARLGALQSNSFIVHEFRGVTFLLGSVCVSTELLRGSRRSLPRAYLVLLLLCTGLLSHCTEMPKGESVFGSYAPYLGLSMLASGMYVACTNMGHDKIAIFACVSLLPATAYFSAQDCGIVEESITLIYLPRLAFAGALCLGFYTCFVKTSWKWKTHQNSTALELALSVAIASSILLGRDGPLAVALAWWASALLMPKWMHSLNDLCDEHRSLIQGMMMHLLALEAFFATGHWSAFDGLQYSKAFIGFEHYNFYVQGALLTLNTFAPQLIVAFLAVHNSCAQAHVACYGISALASMACATLQRRHLMTWGVFAPKLAFESVGLLLAEGITAYAKH